MRLDQALVAAGLAPSRARAQALIAAGAVTVDGRVAGKPSLPVTASAALVVDQTALPWVSRAALKLVAGLDAFGLDPGGAVALDLGASTGGFSQVLLARGAAEVWAVDVGHGQLAAELRDDPRLHVIEGLNVRELTDGHVPPPEFVVADLSFIPLAVALPPALRLARPGAALVALVKPQFEVGPARVGKGGIVRDPAAWADAVVGAKTLLAGEGWSVLGEAPSPIQGGDGNREFLVAARKGSSDTQPDGIGRTPR
ncbi:MAG: TlyA family RNA methyltransferase [Amaricoccus sp.]|uniref:TlyA family RNA methyltransferase n=1 Tax=Amaricoccus sp. TaxID=1872485 RepID=UPI0039E4B63C